MKPKICAILFLTAAWLNPSCSDHTGKPATYFVSIAGDDDNPGTRAKPWKSLQRANQQDLDPGDRILLEGGAVFRGTLLLDSLDSGDSEKKVIIDSFGNEKAIIDSGDSAGISAENCRFFVIQNLTVKGSGRKGGNTASGVIISHSGSLELSGLDISGFQHSGVEINSCSDLRVIGINAHDNGFAGIHVTSGEANSASGYGNENILISHCIASDNAGDPTVTGNHSGNGILASSVRKGAIEYCEAFNNGWDMPWTGNGPVGIWIWDCTDFVIEHCISHDNKTNPKAADGGGFDLDGGVSNSLIQYCVSYNNQGAGYGLYEFGASKKWENNIIRYNISINDGSLNGGSVGVWRSTDSSAMKDCAVYNNTFYNLTDRGYAFMILNNPPGFRYFNNVFVFRNAFLTPGQKLASEVFLSNCYWSPSNSRSFPGNRNFREWVNESGNEQDSGRITGIYADPGFLITGNFPFTDSGNTDPVVQSGKSAGLNLKCFEPKTGSPLADHGIDLKIHFNLDPGQNDITGNPIPQGKGFDIGAIELPAN